MKTLLGLTAPASSVTQSQKPRVKQMKAKVEPPPKKRRKWKEEFSQTASGSSTEDDGGNPVFLFFFENTALKSHSNVSLCMSHPPSDGLFPSECSESNPALSSRFLQTRTMRETFRSFVELLISIALDEDVMTALERTNGQR